MTRNVITILFVHKMFAEFVLPSQFLGLEITMSFINFDCPVSKINIHSVLVVHVLSYYPFCGETS